MLSVFVFGALILAFTVGLLAAQTTDDPWTETAMIVPRNSHTLTLLLDGRVLAAGGWDGVHPLAETELYDPAAGVWRAVGPLSEARVFHTASLLPDGRVLLAGGWDVLGQALTSTEVYDPQAGAWQPGPAMTFSRAGHTATTLPRGLVLVVGGYTAGGLQAAAELYDPATGVWRPAGSLRTARAHHTATRLPDGRVLVVGGWDSENRPLASVEIYDPARNSWRPAAGLATARLDHTATLLPDGTVLVAGGYNGAYLASAEVYDPAKDTWTPAGNLNMARAYHAAVLLADGRVAVLGGSDGVRASEDVELYDPRARGWSVAGRLGRAYASQQALVLRDGKLLITGRPDSGDLTGNDGYPTPTQTPTPAARTPGALDWLLTPRPTATPGARKGKGANTAEENAGRAGNLTSTAAAVIDIDHVSVTETKSQANSLTQGQSASYFNYTSGTEMATRYGVHEVSFQRSLQSGENPFDLTFWVTFTPPTGSGSLPKTVRAFWDGDATWRARAYVDVTGTWSWSSTTGAADSFTVSERPESGLHGMLRVGTAPNKRWCSGICSTFLPMADTAERLFFEMYAAPVPRSVRPNFSTTTMTLTTAANADDFVFKYATDVQQHGINVLRAESLGNWAYTDEEIAQTTCKNPDGSYRACTRLDDCNADLSLFWSTSITGSSNDLFGGGPSLEQMQTLTLYPNLQSFQRIDRKLKLLLNEFPSLYVQLLLVPEPLLNSFDTNWAGPDGIETALKQQLWQTMIAHWAAFPNVFWSISNDIADTKTNNQALAKEVGCYWMGPGAQVSYCDGLSFSTFGNDPWRANRPMSLGHLRNQIDSFIPAPWHTYITNYTGADLSAQAMDGTYPIGPVPTATPDAVNFLYSSQDKPVLNTEDRYEDDAGISDPNYFFRRLFWAHLLSDSGATYGTVNTYEALKTYSTPAPAPALVGLEGERYIRPILRDARVDLTRFTPADGLISKSGSDQWAEFDRAQVARRGAQEILAYIPNAKTPTPPPTAVAHSASERGRAQGRGRGYDRQDDRRRHDRLHQHRLRCHLVQAGPKSRSVIRDQQDDNHWQCHRPHRRYPVHVLPHQLDGRCGVAHRPAMVPHPQYLRTDG